MKVLGLDSIIEGGIMVNRTNIVLFLVFTWIVLGVFANYFVQPDIFGRPVEDLKRQALEEGGGKLSLLDKLKFQIYQKFLDDAGYAFTLLDVFILSVTGDIPSWISTFLGALTLLSTWVIWGMFTFTE